MYNKQAIQAFLVRQNTKPNVIRTISERLEKVADQDGDFPTEKLEEVLGCGLARDYTQAYEKDVGLLVGETDGFLPHLEG